MTQKATNLGKSIFYDDAKCSAMFPEGGSLGCIRMPLCLSTSMAHRFVEWSEFVNNYTTVLSNFQFCCCYRTVIVTVRLLSVTDTTLYNQLVHYKSPWIMSAFTYGKDKGCLSMTRIGCFQLTAINGKH